jgi:hypothetical protein
MQVTDKGMPPDCEKTKHWLTEGDRKLTKEVGCASHSNFQYDGEKQCETCKHKGTRACMSHGYKDLPESCSYKLGVNAEEAMRNLNGTHIDVWTMKHDKEVREKVLDNLGMYLDAELKKASQFNAMRNFAFLDVKRKIEELRQKDGETK